MSLINEHIVKEKIIHKVKELLDQYTSLDYINKIELPSLLQELEIELDKILK